MREFIGMVALLAVLSACGPAQHSSALMKEGDALAFGECVASHQGQQIAMKIGRQSKVIKIHDGIYVVGDIEAGKYVVSMSDKVVNVTLFEACNPNS